MPLYIVHCTAGGQAGKRAQAWLAWERETRLVVASVNGLAQCRMVWRSPWPHFDEPRHVRTWRRDSGKGGTRVTDDRWEGGIRIGEGYSSSLEVEDLVTVGTPWP